MRTQTELSRAMALAREQTDELFRLIRPDSLYERPIAERHRMIFYLGHMEAFDWNLIARYALNKSSFQPEFDKLFAFGIDPPAGQLPCDTAADWPAQAEVERYNGRVRDEIDELLDEVPDQLLHVAIEHRLMHAETFAYILHNLAYDRKAAPPLQMPPRSSRPASTPRMIDVRAGIARLGLRSDEGFGWDNEYQAHTLEVPAFSVSKYKVTNGDYLEFVQAGANPPFFWKECDGRWHYRGMFAECELQLDCPAYVTWEEASAYARWAGKSLPTEAQWQRAAEGAIPFNVNFERWDPVPVTAGADRPGLPVQIVGNGWEWTSTPFSPFPGFEPFPFYMNYSEPFFDGQHYVLKGASPRTAACFLRPSFRNWFRSSYPYLYSTFRLVQS
jgi:iron(II)-dependent oxidoreductase